ncbi:sodium ATP synthase subunit [Lactobacillus acetotolerans]|uniref:Sodium ATP synthase subunit n=1 Tax=Lactobacillus acetotolerans TaxID=1600 RepID=A0A0D6A2G9_9LACO|nr:DUF2325 domain-containing protein [Lactobacillus acetotolerans]BAQ57018.1 sodium ATP synthase subunit [Lactobacillus acetotolerans]
MFDYRNNLKRILNKTTGDDKSLQNSLNAIRVIIAMAGGNKDSNKPVKAKAVKKPDNSQSKANIKQVKQLIIALTKLIASPGDPAAKNSSLSALHQLTFVPDIGKRYGDVLGKLGQAIQDSVTNKDSVNKKIFEQAMKPKKKPKRDYRKGKRYTVIRLVSGCDLINSNGERVYTLRESQIHSLNLKSGDIVEAIAEHNNPHYEATVLRIVGHRKLRTYDYDQIATFKYAVVQGRPNHLAITRNINGKKLRIRGKAVVVPVDSSRYQDDEVHLVDGSIVDLAWYTGDVRLKKNPADAVQIRWIYQVDQPKHNSANNRKKKENKDTSEDVLTKLDMDLHYQRVGVAIGDNQNEAMLESIVKRYNGIPTPIDAFQGKKKVIENQIKDLDIVILVTAFAAHDSTWNIREYVGKYNVKFAVSSSKGYQSFERALYRAENRLPAYEGNQTIEYKTISVK